MYMYAFTGENWTLLHVNNKGLDYPALPCSLFSTFLIQGSHMLEKYLNIQDCLEKSLKIKFALKST